MKTTFKLATLSALLLSLCNAAQAMDLLQAYQAAQKNDATILAARATAAAGRERLPQASAQFLPNLSASVAQTNNQLANTGTDFADKEQTVNTGYQSNNQSITLRQPLYRPYLSAQYQQAKAQVADAEASLVQEEQALAVRVSGAYFEALLTHDQLALVLAQRNAYTKQLDAAVKSLAAGSGTRTDIDEAQARLDMNAALEIEARQNVDYTRQQLQILVNPSNDQTSGPALGPLSPLDVAKLATLARLPTELAHWTERAEQSSPQLQSLRAQVEASRLEVGKAKTGHLPTLDAVAQWTSSESENVTSIKSRYVNNTFGLQLSIPLFAGGYVNASVRQALAAQERAEQLLEAGRRDLNLRVFKEVRGVSESLPKMKALEQALRSSDQLVVSSSKSFQAGSRTVLDVLNAEQQRLSVKRDLSQARYVYLISRIRLLSLVGSADEAALSGISQLLVSK
jgi:protease secretion system outer membrane protein